MEKLQDPPHLKLITPTPPPPQIKTVMNNFNFDV